MAGKQDERALSGVGLDHTAGLAGRLHLVWGREPETGQLFGRIDQVAGKKDVHLRGVQEYATVTRAMPRRRHVMQVPGVAERQASGESADRIGGKFYFFRVKPAGKRKGVLVPGKFLGIHDKPEALHGRDAADMIDMEVGKDHSVYRGQRNAMPGQLLNQFVLRVYSRSDLGPGKPFYQGAGPFKITGVANMAVIPRIDKEEPLGVPDKPAIDRKLRRKFAIPYNVDKP
jgi:hypothetical protein